MSSGVTMREDCLSAFQDLKLKHKYKYIIFQIFEKKEIIVEKTSEDSDYETFVNELPESDCRYIVYDFEYTNDDGGKRNKICFISWSPEDSPVKSKMLYASSRAAIKNSLNGIAVDIQATDSGEISREVVLEKVSFGRS